MEDFERELENIEKLVKQVGAVSIDIPLPKKSSTKRQSRKLAEPHLRPHKSKGRYYYYYIRGTDKEIYLGDAEYIRILVQADKEKNDR